jgi:hypothetical protein
MPYFYPLALKYVRGRFRALSAENMRRMFRALWTHNLRRMFRARRQVVAVGIAATRQLCDLVTLRPYKFIVG